MDAIVDLDWGVYCHFDQSLKDDPNVLLLMQPAYYVGGYVGIAILLGMAIGLFLRRGDRLAAMVSIVSLALGILWLDAVSWLVPRRRPPNAQNWLGEGIHVGSYPAADVLLFTLAMILLGISIWRFTPRRTVRLPFLLVAIGLTVWVTMSRFVLPLHFFSDALGGLAGGGLLGWLAYLSMGPPRNLLCNDPPTPHNEGDDPRLQRNAMP